MQPQLGIRKRFIRSLLGVDRCSPHHQTMGKETLTVFRYQYNVTECGCVMWVCVCSCVRVCDTYMEEMRLTATASLSQQQLMICVAFYEQIWINTFTTSDRYIFHETFRNMKSPLVLCSEVRLCSNRIIIKGWKQHGCVWAWLRKALAWSQVGRIFQVDTETSLLTF